MQQQQASPRLDGFQIVQIGCGDQRRSDGAGERVGAGMHREDLVAGVQIGPIGAPVYALEDGRMHFPAEIGRKACEQIGRSPIAGAADRAR